MGNLHREKRKDFHKEHVVLYFLTQIETVVKYSYRNTEQFDVCLNLLKMTLFKQVKYNIKNHFVI